MMRGIVLALCLVLPLGTQAATPADPELAALLERAQLWQSRLRDDLAREALDKALRIAPDHPDGLVMLARLQFRANQDAEAVKTFERLRRAHPDHPGVAQLNAHIRIRGADKDRLRQARQLAMAGRAEDALKAYRALFPAAFPDDEMAMEYAQVLGATQDGWEPARVLLESLARKHADDPNFRLALVRHVSTRKPIGADTLKSLRELSAVPAVSTQARDAWRRAVMRLDAVEASLPALREYVADVPGDSAVQDRLESVVQTVDQQRRERADPANRAKVEGMTLLEGGRFEAAEESLQQAIARRPNDTEALGAMGLLRLRQGRHAEAQDYFLKVRRLDAANRAKWDGLIRTARYWGLLKQAREAQESGQLDVAERSLLEARSLDPSEPNAAMALARLYAGQGREAEADALIDKLTPAQRGEIGAAINAVRADQLRDKAKLLHSQGRVDEAITAMENAAALDLEDPWLRLDLARRYAARGETERGRELFDAALRRRPGDPDTLFAMALFLSGVDRDSEALVRLEGVGATARTSSMTGLQRRLWVSVQGRRAVTLSKSGRQSEAAQILATARDAIGNDGDLALDVAGAYVQIGDPGAARSLLERFAQPPSQPTLEWRIGQARILDRTGADAPLREALDRMASLGPATPEQEIAIGDLKLSLSIRQADALLAAGQPAQALAVLQGARPTRSTPAQAARRGYAEARALRELQRWEEAAEVYRMILRANPEERDAELALVETLSASGQRDQARQQVAQLLRAPHTGDVDFSASLAGELLELGDFAGARSLVESTLAKSPDHPRALAFAGQLALREGRIDQAIDNLQRSLAAEMSRRPPGEVAQLSRIRQLPDPGSPLSIEAAPAVVVEAERSAASGYRYRQLAELLDQESGWFSSALDWRGRKGSSGKSQISSQELPLEWKQGWDGGGRWFFRADPTRLNAGALDFADSYEASTFGSVLLCQPLCATGTLKQVDQGLALSAGVERAQLRLDLGTSPLGFRVVNVLGGILHKGDLGAFSYSVDASRRPITSSLLSFAGARDPNTGRVWGGVVATGVRLGLSRDSGGTYGAWSSLGLHRLGGKDVLDNDRAQLMAGAYRRVINEEDRQLAVGVTGMVWRFSENAGEFTFGHGGYYSPRSYRSLALPITYGLRTERSSFTVRGSVSVSWAATKEAPYFPTDSGLQAQAEALSAVNGVDPHYASSNGGRSYGRSLAGGWEHQITPSLFIGGRMELERSTNYTPNRFLIYLRLATDRTAARRVALPPEPVLPSSQY